ncbi:MAG: PAS domain S-box protein [Taibaiella sp.]|nr:PAS domain S-box protein [Taibaiella sp.]
MDNTHELDTDFNKFFHSSSCPMWIVDPATLNFLDVNSAAVSQYGFSREEFLERRLEDIRVHGALFHEKNIIDIVQSRNQNTFSDVGSSLHQNKNGDTFYMHVCAQTIEYKGGKASLGLLITDNSRALSEIKNNELNEIIKKHKEQLENILSSVDEVIWSRRAHDLKLVYINNASIDIYGYTPEELLGGEEVLHTLVHPDDKERLQQEIKRVIATGIGNIEYRVYHKDGTLKYIDTHASKYTTAEGEVMINGRAVDVTLLRQTEEELRKKTEEVATILESIQDGFFALDENWNFTYVNKEFEKIYQQNRKEFVGVNYWEMFPKAKNQKFYSEYNKVVKKQKNVYFEEYAHSLNKW